MFHTFWNANNTFTNHVFFIQNKNRDLQRLCIKSLCKCSFVFDRRNPRTKGRLFRCRSKKIWKLRVTGPCDGNPPVSGFSSQRPSNVEIVSIWWRRHESRRFLWNTTFFSQTPGPCLNKDSPSRQCVQKTRRSCGRLSFIIGILILTRLHFYVNIERAPWGPSQ